MIMQVWMKILATTIESGDTVINYASGDGEIEKDHVMIKKTLTLIIYWVMVNGVVDMNYD